MAGAGGRGDVARLAKYHNLTFEEARAKFTKEAHGAKYAMRRKADPHFGKICRFFDQEKRCCGIYQARPYICRAYPTGKCGYYEFLKIERDTQDDQDMIATTQND